MTHSPRPAAVIAATALAVSLSAAVLAQDEDASVATSYTNNEDGSATHHATGVTCPGAVGDLVVFEVLSYDRNDEPLGMACHYASQLGSTASFSVFRADTQQLIGEGTEAERWNRALYGVLANYEGALPAQLDGLGGDPDIDLRGALFTASGPTGLPLQIAFWRTGAGNWMILGDASFLPTASGWAGAAELRQAVIDAKATINSN